MNDNIIRFPIERRMQEIADQEFEREMDETMKDEYFCDDCTDTSQLILTIIEEIIAADSSPFDGMDFRNPELIESKDAFVIVNLLCSMFMRYGGMKHFLQEYLDIIFLKIQAQQESNDIT